MRQRVSSSATCVALMLSGLLSLALACEAASPVEVPSSAVAFAAPARFALWWRLTESCSGLTGDFASVSWYVVPNTTTVPYEGSEANAYWIGNPDRIVLADAHRLDGALVRHEMLHALLRHGGHPRDAFLTACGGVVACSAACAAETGGYPSPPDSAPELQPREVGTRVEVMPPAGVLDSGAAAAVVTITNPRSEPVWVRLTPLQSGDFTYPTFGIVVDYDADARIEAVAAESATSDRFPLGAGESKRWVWDGTLNQGRFGVRGYFNVDSAARQVIQVGQ